MTSAPASSGDDPPPLGSAAPGEHHLLMQAPVPALDVDGLTVVSVGTLMFAVAAVILALDYADLKAEGHGWWLGVAVSGFLLGLVGLLYCGNRRRQRQVGEGTSS